MKDHHEYKKIPLGDSDIATLIVYGKLDTAVTGSYRWTFGKDGTTIPFKLQFGEDGDYSAYLVDDECRVPESYELRLSGKVWLKIYDDHGLVFSERCQEWRIYRRGVFGCIIQLIGKGEY